MPIRNYLCQDCEYEFEYLEMHPEDLPDNCERCEGAKIHKLPTSHGGYHIHGSNSSSTRPKGAGSKSRK